jgi:DNA-binding NtrC family response regulator
MRRAETTTTESQHRAITDTSTIGRRVLVVEDESRLRDMLQRAVRDMGFEINSVSNAEAGVRFFEEHAVDILIADLNLPGMGGMELIEMVHRRWPDIQPIVLTGFGDFQTAKHAMRMDAVDFLTKPCALGDLEIALERARQRRVSRMPHTPVLPDPPPEEEEPHSLKPAPAPVGFTSMSLEEMEKRHILATLEKNNGNRTVTAQELGISLRKLYYRLGQYQREGTTPPA